ncbi:MAG TPA: hypothetical protein VFV58_32250 [Blastocatellia bacterium]|nr:hypothetical protein [Blastocatellia bacterium]
MAVCTFERYQDVTAIFEFIKFERATNSDMNCSAANPSPGARSTRL